MFTQAVYAKPALTIIGIGFIAANSSATVQVFINDKPVVASRVMVSSNTAIIAMGNKKKLGVVKGSNTVKVVVDGVASNSTSFTF